MLIFDLPFPPSVNTYWRKFRNIMVLSQAARDYKQAVAEYVIENKVPKLGDSKLEVTIWLYPPTKRSFDIDNRIKAVLDSCQDAGIYEDDSQVDVLMVQRGKILKGGKATVMIEILQDTDKM